MDFSPYKPSPDEDRKGRLKGKSRSTTPYEPVPTTPSYQAGGNVPPSLYEEGLFTAGPSLGPSTLRGAPGGTVRVNKYETRLPIRVDLEAALAYILGPITGKLS